MRASRVLLLLALLALACLALPVLAQEDAAPALVEADAETETEMAVAIDQETDADADADAEAETDADAEAETDAEDEPALAELSADSDSSVEVVVDQSASAEERAEHEALLQQEVDAELGLDAEAETEVETEAGAEHEEAQAAKEILNAVSDSAAEDYPSLVEAVAGALHAPVIVPANIHAKRAGEIDPVMVKPAQQAAAAGAAKATQQLAVVEDGEISARAMIGITAQIKGSGCGPGKVADLFPIAGVNHHQACVGHDDCYSRCGATKKHCDDVFYTDMKNICNTKYAGTALTKRAGKKLCLSQAWLYYTAVNKLGAKPYSNAQQGAGCARF